MTDLELHNFALPGDWYVSATVELTHADVSQRLEHFGAICVLDEQEVVEVTLVDWQASPEPETDDDVTTILSGIEDWLREHYGVPVNL